MVLEQTTERKVRVCNTVVHAALHYTNCFKWMPPGDVARYGLQTQVIPANKR